MEKTVSIDLNLKELAKIMSALISDYAASQSCETRMVYDKLCAAVDKLLGTTRED